MATIKTLGWIALVYAISGVVGCSDSNLARVSGTIRVNEMPVAGMELEFQPDGRRPPSYAVTDDAGHFEAKFDRNRRGVVLGLHEVRVRPGLAVEVRENASLLQAIKRSYHREPAKFTFPFEVASGENTFDLNFKLENGELIAIRTSDDH